MFGKDSFLMAYRKLGDYEEPDPSDPRLYELQRAAMVAEIGVRLMRPGRYQELNLTAQEARDLATQYIEGQRR